MIENSVPKYQRLSVVKQIYFYKSALTFQPRNIEFGGLFEQSFPDIYTVFCKKKDALFLMDTKT